ncbi:hypothetical protein ACQKLN_30220 [Paenibacillus glucanolyticus]|uniref:hypothetical protein n=1 Tax=Paenibacillus glucanolyticus TaxID=59843 RepID=UPI003CFBF3A8
MKRSSMLLGIAIGIISVILLAVVLKLAAAPFGEAVPQRLAWHDAMRNGHHMAPYGMKFAGHAEAGTSPVWSILLQIAVLVGGAVLFVKGTGVLKWIGAVFAALCIMSLLTPFWGIVVLIATFLLYRRIENNRKYTSPEAMTALPSPIETSVSRGRFLDEWEREQQHKEEK